MVGCVSKERFVLHMNTETTSWVYQAARGRVLGPATIPMGWLTEIK